MTDHGELFGYAGTSDSGTPGESEAIARIEAQLDELDPYGLASTAPDPEWDDEPSFDRNGRRVFLRPVTDTSTPGMGSLRAPRDSAGR